MRGPKTTDDYFEIIKQNHKRYLEANMVTHLTLPGMDNKKPLLERYLTFIKNYHELEQNNLENSMNSPSLAEKAERGAVSSLIGMGIAGLFFAGTQKVPSSDLFGATTAVQGGFAAVIGTSCSALIYKAWEMSAQKPNEADLSACTEAMKQAGFTSEKYASLSKHLITLFHFRECLLLGLEDKNKISMRVAFKNRYYPSDTATFNDADFNLAIEVYFLEQLNALFTNAFQTIYQTHNQEIVEEQNEPHFIRWFKKHFQSKDNQQKFTQQMQLSFMNECIRYLEREVSELSTVGSYRYLFDALAGVLVGALSVGIAAITFLFIPVFALISIAIISSALAAISTHLIITRTDSVYYKRSQENRHAIEETIQNIGREQKRLHTLLQHIVPTTGRDLAALKQYVEQNDPSFFKMLRGEAPQSIAVGSVKGWIREFASRFNESKVVEIDLLPQVKDMVDDAGTQTQTLQHALRAMMAPTTTAPHSLSLERLTRMNSPTEEFTQFIHDTSAYLTNPNHADFIRTFEVIQKIKEQVLEIAGYIPSTITQSLPHVLTHFYTQPIACGGLGGLLSDLQQVRRLAPIVDQEQAIDASHPYQCFLNIAHNIRLKLNAATPSNTLLLGDNQYWTLLGFPLNQTRIEDTLTLANIQTYLNASFDFLCSLNHYQTHTEWDKPFQNTDQFILYRTLLMKQLANLIDPNNMRVDKLITEEIKQFVALKLNCNTEIAFDDILNQALLISHNQDEHQLRDPLGKAHSITELSYIADAVRVNIAYMSAPLSPQQLIAFEAHLFLNKQTDHFIFGYNFTNHVTPEFSAPFYQSIQESIATTTAFLNAIEERALLKQTGTITLYRQVIAQEIARITQQINTCLTQPNNLELTINCEPMQATLHALSTYAKQFPDPQPEIKRVEETPSITSPPTRIRALSRALSDTIQSTMQDVAEQLSPRAMAQRATDVVTHAQAQLTEFGEHMIDRLPHLLHPVHESPVDHSDVSSETPLNEASPRHVQTNNPASFFHTKDRHAQPASKIKTRFHLPHFSWIPSHHPTQIKNQNPEEHSDVNLTT